MNFLTASGCIFFIKVVSKTKHEEKHQNNELFEKTRIINPFNFISFQRNPLNTLNYASMGQRLFWPFIFVKKTLQ